MIPSLLPAAVVAAISAATATAATGKITRYHDSDRFNPAGNIEYGDESALGEYVVVFHGASAGRGITHRFLDAEKFKPLVVFVVSA